ncbi:hypothetical protein DKX38_028088 [Salix brachista]|uniref:Reverse transcriptase Ty1/copia-type domain-containing protein n=1 Tax=Salix brachista TaxID=2182728 RepID=A0A5N5J5W0_9ROSI|nr:hypothetical protein DKX38_028088 [Salix brachista]
MDDDLPDPSLFVHSIHGSIALILYVDDMLLTDSSTTLVICFIQILSREFFMKDLGLIHHFLGIEISLTTNSIHLSQSHYALTILDRSSMLHCKPMSTPLEAKVTVAMDAPSIVDPSQYRSIVGALQYLTLTRPDLSYSVDYVSQFMHNPTVSYWKLVQRILRYLRGTIDIANQVVDIFTKPITKAALASFFSQIVPSAPTQFAGGY